eukprot:COSAG02_NODE_25061_length_670_cov_0.499124_1_plen_172_part_00
MIGDIDPAYRHATSNERRRYALQTCAIIWSMRLNDSEVTLRSTQRSHAAALRSFIIGAIQLGNPGAPGDVPHWTVHDAPDPGKPLCGFTLADGLSTTTVYRATADLGAYNHGAMMDYHFGNFFLTWKNAPRDEDSPGQRILYSQSADGVDWTRTDGRNGTAMLLTLSVRLL